jgi:hypothetical protein
LTSEPLPTDTEHPQGRVWLRDEDPREGAELVFDFPFDEDLNEAVKRMPRRWFDWRRKHWRVPADARIGKLVAELLGSFPQLEATPEVLKWLSESDRWRAAVTVVAHEGAGAFLMRTLAGDPPSELDGALPAGEAKLLLPFDTAGARRLPSLEGVHLDDLARVCARELAEGLSPAPAELSLEIGDHGEPDVTLFTLWDPSLAQEYRRLSEARLVHRPGRYFGRDGSWAVAVPADPALAPALSEFVAAHTALRVDDRVADVLEELVAEHDRAPRPSPSPTRRTPSSMGSSWAASCTRSSAPACATRSSAGARSSPTSRGSARPCRHSPRWRRTMRSRRSWCARRA